MNSTNECNQCVHDHPVGLPIVYSGLNHARCATKIIRIYTRSNELLFLKSGSAQQQVDLTAQNI